MKAEVIIKGISVSSVKYYQSIKDIQTTRKDRLGHFVQDILDLISGKNTKMISVSQQSNPQEFSLLTDRAVLFSASPIWDDANLKESSEHLDYLVESSLLLLLLPNPIKARPAKFVLVCSISGTVLLDGIRVYN